MWQCRLIGFASFRVKYTFTDKPQNQQTDTEHGFQFLLFLQPIIITVTIIIITSAKQVILFLGLFIIRWLVGFSVGNISNKKVEEFL